MHATLLATLLVGRGRSVDLSVRPLVGPLLIARSTRLMAIGLVPDALRLSSGCVCAWKAENSNRARFLPATGVGRQTDREKTTIP